MGRGRDAPPEAKPLRLFVAVDVPEPVKVRLAEEIRPFAQKIPGARWTRSEGWHVTLKFLGATWPRLLPEVRSAISAAAATPAFPSALTALGVFPSPRRARVVWAGLSDPDGRFTEMVKALDESLEDYFVPEKRSFTPHLTLARLQPPRDISEFAPDLVGTPVPSAEFPVDHLVLYRSFLSPHGARYEPLESAPLGG